VPLEDEADEPADADEPRLVEPAQGLVRPAQAVPDVDLARLQAAQAPDQGEQRRLPRAGRTAEDDQLAGHDLEVVVEEDLRGGLAGAEGVADPADAQERFAGRGEAVLDAV
jgi:hypothetical protein